jgi:hypothetical protein
MAGKYASRMDTAALRAAMYEIMYTINSKPLTAKDLDNPEEGVITPNHLLTMKNADLQPPPGDYVPADIYGRKMYSKVEQFAKEFFSRWTDYLTTIETRQKWRKTSSNIKVGDLVAIIDEGTHRNDWKTGVIVAVKTGKDNCVRSATVRIPGRPNNKGETRTSTMLERPVQKLVVIMD